ncbi:MAG: hypothetical protein P1U88_15590 [Thalassobaculaceae bacterium]|nr:hypothetical protein [Thalassobaculaceae bacterium]
MIDGIDHSADEGVVRVTLSGVFAVDDFRRAMTEVVRLREVKGPTHAIWDVTALDFSRIDIDVLRRTSDARTEFAPRRGDERVAVVASASVEKAIMELFLDLSEETRTSQRVFVNRAAAETWCLTGAVPE